MKSHHKKILAHDGALEHEFKRAIMDNVFQGNTDTLQASQNL